MRKIFLRSSCLLFALVACRPAEAFSIYPRQRTAPSQTATRLAPIAFYYEENAQFELTGPQDPRLFIDIGVPSFTIHLPRPQDILLTSAAESHRNYMNYQRSFPGSQLDMTAGPLSAPGIFIQGIASQCKETDDWGTNYIYRIDMAGMRIAVFGEIGQAQLTPEQLQSLGSVDIAIMQLTNYDCGLDLANKQAFHIMDQVQPRLIILTQSDWEAVGYAAQKWSSYATSQNYVAVERSAFSGRTKLLTLGMMASTYQKLFNLQDWQ